MDPITEAYQKTISEGTIKLGNVLPIEKIAKDKKEWQSKVTKLRKTLESRFPEFLFTIDEAEYQVNKDNIAANFRFTVSINIKSKYIDSIPYVNFTSAFNKELESLVKRETGLDIQYNNTGRTFWAFVIS